MCFVGLGLLVMFYKEKPLVPSPALPIAQAQEEKGNGGYATPGPSIAQVPKVTFLEGLKYVWNHPVVLRLILANTLYAFASAGLEVSLPLMATSKRGFDMTVSQYAIISTYSGAYGIFFNMFLLKCLVNRLGEVRTVKIGSLLLAFGLLGYPLSDLYIPNNDPGIYVAIILSSTLCTSGWMIVNSIIAAMISEQVSRDKQGITQGIKKFIVNIFKGMGPISQGALFEWSMRVNAPIVSFVWLSVGFLTSLAIICTIPKKVLEQNANQAHHQKHLVEQ